MESSSSADPSNANESAVSFSYVYEVPADSFIAFRSRVGCDTVNHIGADGLGNTVTAATPPVKDICSGDHNRIVSVEPQRPGDDIGDDLGLTGTRLYKGQRFRFSQPTTIRFGDGSFATVSGGRNSLLRVKECADNNSTLVDFFVRKMLRIRSGETIKFSHGGTPSLGTGFKGTEAVIRYQKSKDRSTVKVKSGRVKCWARKGSKTTVVAGKGQTVVQIGNKAPRIVKG